ncbi:MAG: LPS export ABC transporter periplasmic protein LptC [Azoarcus sp.]|jgi:lipopolysaccharide export system protein LptC|nr:LPS export ABC transporter periplasmic protein LptC [Azoarcus sp.]
MRLFYAVSRFFPLLFALLVALGSIWLERLTREPEAAPVAKVSTAPDFTGDGVRIVGFDADGSLHYTLDSPHMEHAPDTDLTQVEQPKLQMFTKGRRMWIDADHGLVGPQGKRVDFSGHVEAERDGESAREAPTHFSSSKLTVWPDEQRAVSDVPVRLTRGASVVTADSFSADNVFGLLKFSGKVKMNLPRNERKS